MKELLLKENELLTSEIQAVLLEIKEKREAGEHAALSLIEHVKNLHSMRGSNLSYLRRTYPSIPNE